MYTALLIGLLVISAVLLINGFSRQRKGFIIAGGGFLILTGLIFLPLSFWGEMLWFRSVGYSGRFWKVIITKIISSTAGILIALVVVKLLTRSITNRNFEKIFVYIITGFIGFNWGLSHWDTFLRYFHRVSTVISDPVLQKNTGFYLFVLPFLDAIQAIWIPVSLLCLLCALFCRLFAVRKGELIFDLPRKIKKDYSNLYKPVYLTAGVFFLGMAYGKWLDRFHLMYSPMGAVWGPGWTDVRIRLPAYAVSAFISLIFAIILLVPPLRNFIIRKISRTRMQDKHSPLVLLAGGAAAVFTLWFLALSVIPGLFQWLRVEPNEITFEKPYIKNNIEFTRYGFDLDKVEEREFPASEELTRNIIDDNQDLLDNIRLWDWRALDSVYKQFQEIRLYYEFVDVDVDRYTFGDMYRQVMISARELEQNNIPEQSQTFVNKRFKYTHGYGLTLTTVHEFTPEGLPNLLVRNIPPKSEYPELEVERPQIYYGELTNNHVVVNSKEEEFDYPSGEQNIYIQYPGTGGVQISNLWRKFIFGWMFDKTKFFLSSYITSESRIMFHREIGERLNVIAPFLEFDNDPYIVLAEGKLYWIMDAYTVSQYYPYSEPFTSSEFIEYSRAKQRKRILTRTKRGLSGINYIRNSVKVVVDAFNGNVDFYIFDEQDPIIRVWDNIFPDLFKKREEMPEYLKTHIRYPADLLLVQGLVYAKYHMTDPMVFYNQEDLWIRATEKYYNRVQPVQPYYIMWEPPGSDKAEFILMLPFTPKNRQVLIGWIAGMCDPGNYGRFLAYKFPKEKRILGTQQVETKIDQDPILSQRLTLWDQRGSSVIRGNVLVIPIEETLLYVEPIYLKAETAAYPELRLVAVMHNDNLSYAETFDKALIGLFEDVETELPREPVTEEMQTVSSLVEEANSSFEEYLRLQGEGRFREAGDALERLQDTLQSLMQKTGKKPVQDQNQQTE